MLRAGDHLHHHRTQHRIQCDPMRGKGRGEVFQLHSWLLRYVWILCCNFCIQKRSLFMQIVNGTRWPLGKPCFSWEKYVEIKASLLHFIIIRNNFWRFQYNDIIIVILVVVACYAFTYVHSYLILLSFLHQMGLGQI